VDTLNGATLASFAFGYGALGRLTDAAGLGGGYAYTYDPAGNQLTRTTPDGTATYTYDALGQMTLGHHRRAHHQLGLQR